MAPKKEDTTGTDLVDNAPEGLSISDAEAKKARHEGAIEAVKEQGKDARDFLTDGNLPGEPSTDPYAGSDESQQYAWMIDQGLDAFTELLNRKDSPVTEVKAAGLLNLERAGQNRTEYVKLLMKRLKLSGKDDLLKVTSAGPSYTNDLTNISEL